MSFNDRHGVSSQLTIVISRGGQLFRHSANKEKKKPVVRCQGIAVRGGVVLRFMSAWTCPFRNSHLPDGKNPHVVHVAAVDDDAGAVGVGTVGACTGTGTGTVPERAPARKRPRERAPDQ
jgi:hypothetical protein